MFLSEVALGKICSITKDDPTLKKAPANYDSVVARGQVEPGMILFISHDEFCVTRAVLFFNSLFSDPSKDIVITLEGKEVAVPQGKAINQPKYSKSCFSNSEYLIYKESQCRLRYLLELNMH